ncbi:MAG TPA: hypothetical protein VKW06_10610 [Candidatus Angelobacter sp.]|nr:hypothetical protein [Candidatus Angelobacter sp.]
MAAKFFPGYRVVVYNTAGSYNSTGERRNPLPGFVNAYSVPELCAALRAAGSEGPARVCFTPLRSGNKREVFNDVCFLVCDFRNVIFAVEEIWNFQAPNWSPDALNECYLQWAHYGLRLMWNAQIPQKTDSALRSMTLDVYVGQFDRTLDLNAIADCRLPPEAMAQVRRLPKRKFIHRMESGEWRVEP